MKIFVVGASGQIGRATLQALVSEHGETVEAYAGVRDVAKFGTMKGVTAIQADMGKREELAKTLKAESFDGVYLVVPGTENRTQLALDGIQAAKDAGVKFLLVLSVLTSGTESIFGKQFEPIEAAVKSSGLKHAIVRVPLFIENNLGNIESIKGQGTFYDPRDPTKMHTAVSTADAGTAAAAILINPTKHLGKIYKIVSPAFSLNDLAAALTKNLGKDVTATTVPYPAAKESMVGMGFPEWQADGVLELFKYIDEGSELTNEKQDGDFKAITGKQPVTIEAWVAKNASSFQ